jgi:glutamyl-tRNA synthetase
MSQSSNNAPKAQIVTRFAPSPTGFLHIGGARTALFNWAFARHHQGRFLLRIEDTDRARSTDEAVAAILDGMQWLGLEADDAPVYQHANAPRHVAVVEQLLASGHAYKCTCTPDEVNAMREAARAAGKPPRYDGTCRDGSAKDGAPYVVRFKTPQDGETVISDQVQGDVRIANDQLDDLIILRSDGTPTYMLSVVVDDYDMGVTHIIRGDDHLTNAFRQVQIYTAMGWPIPVFAHIPLIHGADGAKLSKRHGALGVDAYRDMGYLPEAMRNYLARLGWSHGDDEVFSTEELIAWFSLQSVGKSPSRFDIDKLNNVNGHHLRNHDDAALATLICALEPDFEAVREKLTHAMPQLKERAKSLHEIVAGGAFLKAARPIQIDENAAKNLNDETKPRLQQVHTRLAALTSWSKDSIEAELRAYLDENQLKLGQIGLGLRAALVGNKQGPGIFDVLALLDQNEALSRIADQIQ